jgi:XTP/dITP diphosphohydrolase
VTERRLVVASHNRAKACEIADILRSEGLDFEVLSLADFPEIVLPEETGDTFARNAADKAVFVAQALGRPAVADDSGLEVDALNGEPGVRSARFAGPEASDEDRYRKLLGLLVDVPESERTARFRCAAAYADPAGRTILAEGACEGRIALSPAGSGGFGYDPVFLPAGKTRTMAQLTPVEKHAISHRGRAFRELARLIRAAIERR